MSDSYHEKIVEFTFCKICEHRDKKESEEPCADCLDNPVNSESKRPIHFKNSKYEARFRKRRKTNE